MVFISPCPRHVESDVYGTAYFIIPIMEELEAEPYHRPSDDKQVQLLRDGRID